MFLAVVISMLCAVVSGEGVRTQAQVGLPYLDIYLGRYVQKYDTPPGQRL